MARQMTDSHRRFLQTMMSNGVMESSKANALCLHFCRDQSVPAQLDEFIGVINAELQPMFMHIRKGMCEDDGHQYYALVNMAETDITRMSSDYADNELELFRKTMDLIVDSERGRASSTDILNCADRLQTKKMKKKEVENLLDRLVQDKWLNEKRGEYTLSTRCIIEMEPYIRNIYQDLVKPCAICHSLAFQSQTCENCGVRIHLPCAAKFFKNNTDPRCPSCKDYWPHEIPVFQFQTLSQSASSRASTAPASTASRTRRK
ncbi:non-structural maintenance of chromosomes element 1 homolog isoform X1 [Anguilla rostrata]|uniref:non-structural maintenance of chromosomes element 1 homolog isoform X1 n=1 Tax=Anguilla rostrata TaxID=7938 RepID=UPI0030CC7E7B